MSVARFIADQRTNYRVPHAVVCALLGVSLAWFYKWLGRAQGPGAVNGLHTDRDRCRDTANRALRVALRKARGLHGSPWLHADLLDDGWTVSEKTVADSMRREGTLLSRAVAHGAVVMMPTTASAIPSPCRAEILSRRTTTAQMFIVAATIETLPFSNPLKNNRYRGEDDRRRACDLRPEERCKGADALRQDSAQEVVDPPQPNMPHTPSRALSIVVLTRATPPQTQGAGAPRRSVSIGRPPEPARRCPSLA